MNTITRHTVIITSSYARRSSQFSNSFLLEGDSIPHLIGCAAAVSVVGWAESVLHWAVTSSILSVWSGVREHETPSVVRCMTYWDYRALFVWLKILHQTAARMRSWNLPGHKPRPPAYHVVCVMSPRAESFSFAQPKNSGCRRRKWRKAALDAARPPSWNFGNVKE